MNPNQHNTLGDIAAYNTSLLAPRRALQVKITMLWPCFLTPENKGQCGSFQCLHFQMIQQPFILSDIKPVSKDQLTILIQCSWNDNYYVERMLFTEVFLSLSFAYVKHKSATNTDKTSELDGSTEDCALNTSSPVMPTTVEASKSRNQRGCNWARDEDPSNPNTTTSICAQDSRPFLHKGLGLTEPFSVSKRTRRWIILNSL